MGINRKEAGLALSGRGASYNSLLAETRGVEASTHLNWKAQKCAA